MLQSAFWLLTDEVLNYHMILVIDPGAIPQCAVPVDSVDRRLEVHAMCRCVGTFHRISLNIFTILMIVSLCYIYAELVRVTSLLDLIIAGYVIDVLVGWTTIVLGWTIGEELIESCWRSSREILFATYFACIAFRPVLVHQIWVSISDTSFFRPMKTYTPRQKFPIIMVYPIESFILFLVYTWTGRLVQMHWSGFSITPIGPQQSSWCIATVKCICASDIWLQLLFMPRRAVWIWDSSTIGAIYDGHLYIFSDIHVINAVVSLCTCKNNIYDETHETSFNSFYDQKGVWHMASWQD